MRKMVTRRRRATGYTLMELLIVITIIGVLLGIAVVNLQGTPDEARIAAASQEIRTMGTALDMYRMHNSRYPTSDQGLKALVEKPGDARRWQKGGYLKGSKVPLDPWDNPYVYNVPGRSGEFEVYSLGPDGRESDDDIGSWMLE
ncbi:MAG: type II secretion system major pseudopilin GspG [Thiolinea sp.]